MIHSINYYFKGLITTSSIIQQTMFGSTVITKFIKDEIIIMFIIYQAIILFSLRDYIFKGLLINHRKYRLM